MTTIEVRDNREYIVISDPDGDAPGTPSVVELQRNLQNARVEIKTIKKEFSALKQELLSGLFIKGTLVDEVFGCGICTSRMRSPCVLSGCGHTFCRACLLAWFQSIRHKFLALHPDLDIYPYLPVALRLLMTNRREWVEDEESRLLMDQQLGAFRRIQPRYTCPTCRAEVYSKPSRVPLLQAIWEFLPKDTDIEVLGGGMLHPSELGEDLLIFDKFFEGRLDVR